MKIGELALAAQCTVETVRYYEKEGLLEPMLSTPLGQLPLLKKGANYVEQASISMPNRFR